MVVKQLAHLCGVDAALRFARIRRPIDSADPRDEAVGADLALAAMVTALGLTLVLYLLHTLFNGI